eukprot:CAMPEP_0182544994 /NCGR_PEP_ID=MMETSP1323-20130603/33963_1 /TAXON_ID=236787 /ORGANISM="Florenciella parvula, Strain RCC1693" /LENGTH=156 /DNA_ID=CAMNT_0024756105 /DNA_START=27 /DNA_END=494 /DNA_ORIENTATION=-
MDQSVQLHTERPCRLEGLVERGERIHHLVDVEVVHLLAQILKLRLGSVTTFPLLQRNDELDVGVAHVAIEVELLDRAEISQVHGDLLRFAPRCNRPPRLRQRLPMPLLHDIQRRVHEEVEAEHLVLVAYLGATALRGPESGADVEGLLAQAVFIHA